VKTYENGEEDLAGAVSEGGSGDYVDQFVVDAVAVGVNFLQHL